MYINPHLKIVPNKYTIYYCFEFVNVKDYFIFFAGFTIVIYFFTVEMNRHVDVEGQGR